MSDLIDRRAAIDAVQHAFDRETLLNSFVRKVAVDALKTMPSAQPEIIRCRDCKYWREHKYAKETKRYIPFCGFNAIYTKADDFCSRAERRIDE